MFFNLKPTVTYAKLYKKNLQRKDRVSFGN
jgi:hypothetical protein